MSIPAPESKEEIKETKELQRLFAHKLRDYVEQELARMWSNEWDMQDLRNFVYQLYDPVRREMFLRVINDFEVGSAPNPLKSRVFRETLEEDALSDLHERFIQAGDLLSELSFRVGSHLHGVASKRRRFTEI